MSIIKKYKVVTCPLVKRVILFGSILLSVIRISGQERCFTVIDTLTFKPIPYCNVSNENGQGLVTNHLGQFCIKFTQQASPNTLSVSNISYHEKTIDVSLDTVSVMYLKPKQYDLNEVNINWSNYKFYWRGNTVKRPDSYINLWRFCQLGLHVPALKNGNGIIEKISVPIRNSSEHKVPFRLHVFSVDSVGGVGVELLPENVYGCLSDTDYKLVELDILKYQIEIPREGVFVTIELLSNNKPNELQLGDQKYYERHNNRIALTKARYGHRKMIKVSAWKPNSFYVEKYPFTNVEGIYGDLPLIKVKVRRIKR